jgi:hypothetical protein
VERPTWAPEHTVVDRPRVDRVDDHSIGCSPDIIAAPEYPLLRLDTMPDVTGPAPRLDSLRGPALCRADPPDPALRPASDAGSKV